MIKKCLFPIAGYGTRFLPATKAMPKEMLPILNKPLIQYAVEEAVEADIRDIAFVTGRGKRAIEDHFDVSYELEHEISGTAKEQYLSGIRCLIAKCTFSYTRQVAAKGLGHAILTGETLIGNTPFGVILADDLCISDGRNVLSQMIEVYNEHRCSVVAIEEVARSETSSYGIVAGPEMESGLMRIEQMVEKPNAADAPSNLAIIGRYILTPDIFDVLRDTEPGAGGEIQLTDALRVKARRGEVLGYRFRGRRFDCGTLRGFREATNHFYDLMASE
jgi:UTP--glucose-1-phosphate uridylyltransferase